MAHQVTIAQLVRYLTQCSGNEAQNTERVICQTPEAIAALSLACGGSVYLTYTGRVVAKAGVATADIPLALAGAGVCIVGSMFFKRFRFAGAGMLETV
jgi:hypothetical protein